MSGSSRYKRRRPLRTAPLDVDIKSSGSYEIRRVRVRGPPCYLDVVNYLYTHDDAGPPSLLSISLAGERDFRSIGSTLVHAVLRKPFDPTGLLQAVEQCLEHDQG